MEHIDHISHYLKALADPTRLRLVQLILKAPHPMCVNALAHKLGITQSAVSQHLRILRQLDLVIHRRCKSFMHYEINTAKLAKYQEEFVQLMR